MNRFAHKKPFPVFQPRALGILGLIMLMPVLLSLVSCRDPIFAQIQEETKLKSAVISGGPTNIFRLRDELYVASGKIYHYGIKTGRRWKVLEHQPPGNKVLGLAGGMNTLFALTSNGQNLDSTRLYYQKEDETWERIPYKFGAQEEEFPYIQSVFGAENGIFAGAYKTYTSDDGKLLVYYWVLRVGNDNDGNLILANLSFPDGHVPGGLTGVCYSSDYYYLATGGGLFSIEKNSGYITYEAEGNFLNIIAIGDDLVAGSIRNPDGADFLWKCTPGSNGESGQTAYYLTAAMALWCDPRTEPQEGVDIPQLLLLGHGRPPSTITTYTYGYYEKPLDSDGSLDFSSLRLYNPGEERISDGPTTIDSNAQYASSLGTHGINSILQAPREIDPDMPIFASTQKDGLWSLRYEAGSGRREWNVED